jgi:parallel beta-helix repeat protein
MVISDSNSITIINNTCNYNEGIGIFLSASDRCIFINNTFESNILSGLGIGYSESAIVSNNRFTNCGISISSSKLSGWNTHNIDSTNLVNNRSIYYLKNTKGSTIQSDFSQIILANCTSIIINDQNLSNVSYGISLGFSNYNRIFNNTCNSNNYGIFLSYSDSNSINDNICLNNNYGLTISYSNSNFISNNTFNRNNGVGITIRYSNRNHFFNNSCNYNIWRGMTVDGSEQNIFQQNNFSNNKQGIRIDSDNNKFYENTISFNSEICVSLANFRNNIFYYNNLISNTIQVSQGQINLWSYYGHGNYWLDYEGDDNGEFGIQGTHFLMWFQMAGNYQL